MPSDISTELDEWGPLLNDLQADSRNASSTSPIRHSIPQLPSSVDGLPATACPPSAMNLTHDDAKVQGAVRPPRPPSTDEAESDFWAALSSTRGSKNGYKSPDNAAVGGVPTPSTNGKVRSITRPSRPPRQPSVDEEMESNFPPDLFNSANFNRCSTSALAPIPEPPPGFRVEQIRELHSSIRWNREKDVRRLLNTPNVGPYIAGMPDSNNGNTALHVAAQNGHLKLVEQILEMNISPNVQNKMGNTPMHMSVTYNHDQITRLLIVAGADRSTLNAKGHSADSGIDGEQAKTFETWTIDDEETFGDHDLTPVPLSRSLTPVPAA